jgi:putative ABC transport system substrate-binding protein
VGARIVALDVALGIILAVSVLAAPPAAMAQAEKAVRIGVLRPAPDDPVFRRNIEPFRQALRQRGFLEGTNLTIEWRGRAGRAEEILALAGELVRLNVDAILAIAPAGVKAAGRTTKSIPIVAVDLETDPKAAGFVASLARPGGNITGLFLDFPELGGKWVELVKEVVPKLAKFAVFWDPATGPSFLKGAEAAARALKVQMLLLEVRGPGDFAGAFKSAASERVGAVLVLGSPVFNSARKQIAELAAKHRMPAIMPFGGFAEDGGLMAYGPHLGTMFQQAGGVMAKVLQGTRPGEIPIERPTRFELVINLQTAKALGVTIPNSMLVRADRVIE